MQNMGPHKFPSTAVGTGENCNVIERRSMSVGTVTGHPFPLTGRCYNCIVVQLLKEKVDLNLLLCHHRLQILYR